MSFEVITEPDEKKAHFDALREIKPTLRPVGARSHRLRGWAIAVGLAGLLAVIGFVKGTPAYQGPFQDLVDSSIYILDDKPIQLFGVIDPKPIDLQHRTYVLKEIHQILDGQTLMCYRFGEGIHYQCYVDGVDLAILLIRKGLVVPIRGAPPEYVSEQEEPI